MVVNQPFIICMEYKTYGDRAVKLEKWPISNFGTEQAATTWRASGDRQISPQCQRGARVCKFSRQKHRILQLQIFATKTSFLHIFATKTFFYKFCNKKLQFFYNCMKTSIFTVLQSSQMILVHMRQQDLKLQDLKRTQ